MKRSRINLIYFFVVLLSLGCSTQQEEESTITPYAQPKEHEETVYTGEYLKIIDEETENQPKQPRLINAKAPLHLGRIDFTLGDTSMTYTTFQKGYTDMHFGKSGVKMRIHDMYDASFNIHLSTDDVFTKTIRTYYPETKKKQPFASLSYTNTFGGETKKYDWISGRLEVKEFSTVQGKIVIHVTGEMVTNEKDTAPIDLKMDLLFEHVHSSVQPKK